jgi:hypothetical protein
MGKCGGPTADTLLWDKTIMSLKLALESLLIFGLGILAIVEGLRLHAKWRPEGVYDFIGGDYFLIGVGVLLLFDVAIYTLSHIKWSDHAKKALMPGGETKGGAFSKDIGLVGITVGILFFYIALIPFLGYLVPTLGFFILYFVIVRYRRSQFANVILGLFIACLFFVLFSRLLGMFFPRGYFGIDSMIF